MALLFLNTTPQILATLRSASQLEVQLSPVSDRAGAEFTALRSTSPSPCARRRCFTLRARWCRGGYCTLPASLCGGRPALWGTLLVRAVPPRLHTSRSLLASPDAWLHTLARTGGLHLAGTPARRQRSPELVQRLETLRARAEELQYQTLVTDVTLRETAERGRVPISGAMREVGYGVHVLSVMATCFRAFPPIWCRLRFTDAMPLSGCPHRRPQPVLGPGHPVRNRSFGHAPVTGCGDGAVRDT